MDDDTNRDLVMNTWPWNPKVLDYDTFLDVDELKNKAKGFRTLKVHTSLPQRAVVAFQQAWQEKREGQVAILSEVDIEPRWITTEVLTVQRKRYGGFYKNTAETMFMFGVVHNNAIQRANGTWDPTELGAPPDPAMPFALQKPQPVNADAGLGLEVSIRNYNLIVGKHNNRNITKSIRAVYVHHLQANVTFPLSEKATAFLGQELNHIVSPSIKTLTANGILEPNKGDKVFRDGVLKMLFRLAVYFGKARGCTHVMLQDASRFKQGAHVMPAMLVRLIQGSPTLYESIDPYDPLHPAATAAKLSLVEKYVKTTRSVKLHEQDYLTRMSNHVFTHANTKWGSLRQSKNVQISCFVENVRTLLLGDAVPQDDMTFRALVTKWYSAIRTVQPDMIRVNMQEKKFPGTAKETVDWYPEYKRFKIGDYNSENYAAFLLAGCVGELMTRFPNKGQYKQAHEEISAFLEIFDYNGMGGGVEIDMMGPIPDSFADKLKMLDMRNFKTYGDLFDIAEYKDPEFDRFLASPVNVPDVEIIED